MFYNKEEKHEINCRSWKPWKEYEETRHNVGFKVIDELAERFSIDLNEAKFKGLFGKGMIRGEKVILLKPMTYMNLSAKRWLPNELL